MHEGVADPHEYNDKRCCAFGLATSFYRIDDGDGQKCQKDCCPHLARRTRSNDLVNLGD